MLHMNALLTYHRRVPPASSPDSVDPEANSAQRAEAGAGVSRRPPVAARAQERGSAADVLRKPVNALAIVPQSVRITYLARKAYNVLLYEAQDQGIEQDVYRAPLEQIIRGVEFDSHDTALIKKHLRAMVTTSVEWQSPTAGEGVAWNVCGLLAHARLYKERGQNWVEWSYAINLKQELLEPSVFARLRLEVLTQLRSHTGVALYEICSRYRDIGRTARNPWRWWHPVLTGQPPDPAKLEKLDYRFFKRDTLRGAIAEVSAITDLEVELIEHRKGRFIDEIQFAIRPKRQAQLPLAAHRQPVDLHLLKDMVALGVNDQVAERLLEQHGEEAVLIALPTLRRRLESAYPHPIKDAGRYLKTLLEQVPPAHVGDASAPPVDAAVASTPQRLAINERVRADWTARWREGRIAALKAEIAQLSESALADLLQLVREDHAARQVHPSVARRLRNSGWSHPMVVADVVRVYAEGAYGSQWDHPTADDLLKVAAGLAQPDSRASTA
jgi:hypothetical protein